MVSLARKWAESYEQSPTHQSRLSQGRAHNLLFELEMAGVLGREASVQCACEALALLSSSGVPQLVFRHWHG